VQLGRIVPLVVAGLLATACSGGAKDAVVNQAVTERMALVPAGIHDVLADARRRVADSLAGRAGFVPPEQGPRAQRKGGAIVYVAADLTNGGVAAVGAAVAEAAGEIGWHVLTLDGKGTAQGRADALDRAVTIRPDGIVLGGFDATEQAATIRHAVDLGIPVVGWHAGPTPGPVPAAGVFTNVTTDPLQVAWLAAAYAVADSDGTAGVVLLTDSEYQVAARKAEAMRAYLGLCAGCAVLSAEDSPIGDTDISMTGLVSSLLRRDGGRLGYLLAVNGNYFGGAEPELSNAGKPAAGPPVAVAAGDGDGAEFRRIRDGGHQAATVAEPLALQGWQVVDELNRALAGRPPSGFVAPPALITRRNVPAGDVFDPPSGYRDVYRKAWNGS
jgi:ribose transport system substrate-binding protein